VYTFLLDSTDTSSFFINEIFPRPSHPSDPAINFAVTANNFTAMSVSFKTGDPAYPTHALTGAGGAAFPGSYDTVRKSSGIGGTISYKYNEFDLLVNYASTAASNSGTPTFPPYDWNKGDYTSGYFKRENAGFWGNQYIPNWAWTTSGGSAASDLQYPQIIYHVACPSCPVIGSALGVQNVTENTLKVYPNPANDEVSFTFSSTPSADTKITLTNMLGQVITTQHVTNSNTVISTSTLAEGVYIYSVQSNGTVNTGRIVVAH
jgi:hypothetical protein